LKKLYSSNLFDNNENDDNSDYHSCIIILRKIKLNNKSNIFF